MTKKDPRRQLQGAKSHAKGAAFEKKLDETFAAYRRAGAAVISKTPEPMRPTRNLGNGKFEAFFIKKAQPDYEGTIRGGRTVVFEAKYTDTAKLEQSRVTAEQSAYMTEKTALGARCYVVVAFGGNVYRIPWPVWAEMKNVFGRKYVTEADLTEYKTKEAANGMLLLL